MNNGVMGKAPDWKSEKSKSGSRVFANSVSINQSLIVLILVYSFV